MNLTYQQVDVEMWKTKKINYDQTDSPRDKSYENQNNLFNNHVHINDEKTDEFLGNIYFCSRRSM